MTMPAGPALRSSHHGFTVVELVVVISVVGVLAAVAVPRLMGSDAFASRGFYDQAMETVRFAQKTSIAWRAEIFVCVTATSITASAVSGCGTPLTHPATGAALSANAPSGVTLTPVAFSFTAPAAAQAGGRPNPDAQIVIALASTIPGDPARQIVVERETGYVHP